MGFGLFGISLGEGSGSRKDLMFATGPRAELRQLGRVKPHAYFGTGVLSCDVKYLPWYYKPIPKISDALLHVKPLHGIAILTGLVLINSVSVGFPPLMQTLFTQGLAAVVLDY